MRQLFLVIASIFTILSVIFAFLPLGTLAFIPIGIALIFGFLTLKKSDMRQSKWVKLFLVITVLSLLIVVGKAIFITDAVETDQQFDTQKRESKNEAQKELEDLE
ncbi:hypothetical protein [Flavobacterium sp.]|uniref:hypothetical protein n=1 Tax=Flavobacterium sp. TaxID=239 RepID=UPI00286C0F3B|nr:hypothetical protein [Flavobacterium sp.]